MPPRRICSEFAGNRCRRHPQNTGHSFGRRHRDAWLAVNARRQTLRRSAVPGRLRTQLIGTHHLIAARAGAAINTMQFTACHATRARRKTCETARNARPHIHIASARTRDALARAQHRYAISPLVKTLGSTKKTGKLTAIKSVFEGKFHSSSTAIATKES